MNVERQKSRPQFGPIGLTDWLRSFAGRSYAVSLLLHLTLLLIGSLVIFEHVRNEPFSTVLSASDEAGVVIQDIVDTRIQLEDFPEKSPLPLEFAADDLKDSNLMQLPDVLLDPVALDETGIEDEELSSGFKYSMPTGGKSVTKGSFTAWTIPEDPVVLEPYLIVIQIALPKRVRRYRISDLSGSVTGTDKYDQILPWDSRNPTSTLKTNDEGDLIPVKPQSRLPIREQRVQLIIKIPGAKKQATDTIRIKSKILKEEQTLEIVF